MRSLLRMATLLALTAAGASLWRWLRGPDAPVFSEPWPADRPWPAIEG